MENNFERELVYQEAKAELKTKGRTLGGIWLFWFIFLNLFSWGGDTSIWQLAKDSLTASQALYIPYRVGYGMTGTPVGGAIGALMISLWISSWIGNHELLGWLMIVGGYVIDFGPSIYKLMITRRR